MNQEHVQVFLVERKRGNSILDKAVFAVQSNCLAYRFRIKKAGMFCPDEPPFGVRCPASDEK
ncbi:MAG TPA: hypothetical protein PK971_02130, partial [Saprospiraceae bacterium]|nr:hypothetical protein [Saprospiraceae bacterium]